RLGDRIVAVDGLAAVVALVQTHAATAAQIDGREQLHHAVRSLCASLSRTMTSTKLRSNRSPCAPDFSGWNWVARTLSRRTTAGTGPPYSHVAMTSSDISAA